MYNNDIKTQYILQSNKTGLDWTSITCYQSGWNLILLLQVLVLRVKVQEVIRLLNYSGAVFFMFCYSYLRKGTVLYDYLGLKHLPARLSRALLTSFRVLLRTLLTKI